MVDRANHVGSIVRGDMALDLPNCSYLCRGSSPYITGVPVGVIIPCMLFHLRLFRDGMFVDLAPRQKYSQLLRDRSTTTTRVCFLLALSNRVWDAFINSHDLNYALASVITYRKRDPMPVPAGYLSITAA